MATTTTTIYNQQQSTITMSNTNFTKRSDLTSLVRALQDGDYAQVNQLLTKRTLGKEKSRVGRTALHYIAENGNTDCLELLTSLGDFDLNSTDHEGHTALHLAVINGNRDSVQILINAKANINCLDHEKHSLVHWATVCGESEILALLLLNGANASTNDIHNATPLHYASQMCGRTNNAKANNQEKFNVPRSRSIIILRQLIQHNVNVSVKDQDGREPLLWAASAGSSEAILALVNAGASVDAEDKDGLTALHCAASRGHTDCIETLIGLCGCNVDIIDNNGCTALFYCVTLGHPDATELLLNYGAEPNRQDRKGRTPAHCASSKGQLETIKQIHKHGANLWMRNVRGELPLHEAILSRRKELVLWLLSQRPESVNSVNNDGRSCLHLASLSNNVQMVKILLDHSADLNPVMRNSKGTHMTPLDAALHRGNSAVAKFLQLHGGVAFNSLNDPKFMSRILVSQNRSTDSRLSNNMMTSSRLTYNNMTNIQCSTPDNHVVLTPDYIISSTPIQHYYNDGLVHEVTEEKKLMMMMEEQNQDAGVRINMSEESEGFEHNKHNGFDMINNGGTLDNRNNMMYMERHSRTVVHENMQNEQHRTDSRGGGTIVHKISQQGSLSKSEESSKGGTTISGTVTGTGSGEGEGSNTDQGMLSDEINSMRAESREIQGILKSGSRAEELLTSTDEGKGTEETEETEGMSQEEGGRRKGASGSGTGTGTGSGSGTGTGTGTGETSDEKKTDDEHDMSIAKSSPIDPVDYELIDNVPEKKRRYNKNVKSAHHTNAASNNMRKKKFRKTKSIEGKSIGLDEEYVKKERARITSARSLSPIKRKSAKVKTGARSCSPNNIRADYGSAGNDSVASSRSVSLEVMAGHSEDETIDEDTRKSHTSMSRKSVIDKKSRSSSVKSDGSEGLKSRSNSRKSINNEETSKSRSNSRKSRQDQEEDHDDLDDIDHGPGYRDDDEKENDGKSRSTSRKSIKGHVDRSESRDSRKSLSNNSRQVSINEEASRGKSRPSSSKSKKSTKSLSRSHKSKHDDDEEEEEEEEEQMDVDSRPSSSSKSKSKSKEREKEKNRKNKEKDKEPQYEITTKKSLRSSKSSKSLIEQEKSASEPEPDENDNDNELESQNENEILTSKSSSAPKLKKSQKSKSKSDIQSIGKVDTTSVKSMKSTSKSLPRSIPTTNNRKVKRSESNSSKEDAQSVLSKGSGSNSENTEDSKTQTETTKTRMTRKSKTTKKTTVTSSNQSENSQQSGSQSGSGSNGSSCTEEIDYGNAINLKEAVMKRKSKPRTKDVKLPLKLKQSDYPVDGKISRVRNVNKGKGMTPSEEREIDIQNKIIGGKKQSVLYDMSKVDKLDKQIYSRSTSRMNESGLGYGRVLPNTKGTDVETTVSVTQAMQVSMRKYTLERHIFSQLLELKRLDMENGQNRTAESMIVKRLVEANRRAGLNYQFRDFDASFTFRNYEKYLYDQLKLLQNGNKKLLPRFAPSDDIEKLTVALRSFSNKQTSFPYIHDQEGTKECQHITHKCHHAAHAYTGVPCAAYIPKPVKASSGPKKRSLLPRVNPAKAPGPIQKIDRAPPLQQVGHNSAKQLERETDIPHAPSPITLQLQQGDKKSTFQLPASTDLDPHKNYYVSLSIKPTPTQGSTENLNVSI